MYEYRLVVCVVSDILEEDAATEGRDLKRGDVYVRVEGAPGVCADAVGDEGCEEAIKVEEEEDSQNAAYQQLNQEHPRRCQSDCECILSRLYTN